MPSSLILFALVLMATAASGGDVDLFGCVVELPLSQDAEGLLSVRARLGLGTPPSTSLSHVTAPTTAASSSPLAGPSPTRTLHMRLAIAAPARHTLSASPAALSRSAKQETSGLWRDVLLFENGLEVAQFAVDPSLSTASIFSLGVNSSVWTRYLRAEVCAPRLRLYLLRRAPDCPQDTPLQCPVRTAAVTRAPLGFFASGRDTLSLDVRHASGVVTAGGGVRQTPPFLDTAEYSGPVTVLLLAIGASALLLLLAPWAAATLTPVRIAAEAAVHLLIHGLVVTLLHRVPLEARVRSWAPVASDPTGDAAFALVCAPLRVWGQATLPAAHGLLVALAVASQWRGAAGHGALPVPLPSGVDAHARVERRLLLLLALLLPVQATLIPNPQHLELFFLGTSTFGYLLLRACELGTSLAIYHWRLRRRMPLPLAVAGWGSLVYVMAGLVVSTTAFTKYTLYPGVLTNMRLLPFTATVMAVLLALAAPIVGVMQGGRLWWADPSAEAPANDPRPLTQRMKERNALPASTPSLNDTILASVFVIISLSNGRAETEWMRENLLFGIILFAFMYVYRPPLLTAVRALGHNTWHSAANVLSLAVQVIDATMTGLYVAGLIIIMPLNLNFAVINVLRFAILAVCILSMVGIGRHAPFDDPVVERGWVPQRGRALGAAPF